MPRRRSKAIRPSVARSRGWAPKHRRNGVSIPAVARLMRHKDGGGLLLKKYTQGFEEEELTITM